MLDKLGSDENTVLHFLASGGGKAWQELINELGRSVDDMAAVLLRLELSGLIEQGSDGIYLARCEPRGR